MAGARGQRRRSRRSERGAAAALRPLRPRSRAASASPRAAGAGPPPRHGERDAAVGRAASADPGELAAAERQPRAARPRPLQQVSGAMRPPRPGPGRADPCGRDGRAPLLGEQRFPALGGAPGPLPPRALFPPAAGGPRGAAGAVGQRVGQGRGPPLRAAALPSPSLASENFASGDGERERCGGQVLCAPTRSSPALTPRLLLSEGLRTREALGGPRYRPGRQGGIQSQGRGNGVTDGMADTQLLASPQQINVLIM